MSSALCIASIFRMARWSKQPSTKFFF